MQCLFVSTSACDLQVAEVCGVEDVLFILSIAGSLWEHPRLLTCHSAMPAPHEVTLLFTIPLH